MDLRRVRQSGALGLFVGAFLLGYAVLTGLRPELPFAHHESTLLLLGTAALVYGLVARHNERDYRAVFRPAGAVVIGLGVCIWLCLVTAFLFELVAPDPSKPDAREGYLALGLAGGSALVLGALMAWVGETGETRKRAQFSRREAILAVCLIWLAASLVGGLPFLYGADMSATDSFFETVSGLTTTGASVITDIEARLSRPLLLWRSMIQGLGGMGIVVLFVAVFPNVGVGGKHMFRGEVPGTTAEGLRPRIAETSVVLWKLYALLTIVLVIALRLTGISTFDALCHSFATMGTGGLSTRDASIGAFQNPAAEYVIAIFMVVASVNYALYYAMFRDRSLRRVLQNVELKVFLALVVGATLAITAMLYSSGVHGQLELAFRRSLFLVGTTVSSTGFTTDDYTVYPSPAFGLMIFIMFIGGCSGSTAGGLKVERVVLLVKQSVAQVKKSFRPSTMLNVRMGRAVVENEVLADVAAFFLIYMGCLAGGAFAVCWIEGCPVPTAFGGMLTCLSNMGPAPFHELVWPAMGDVTAVRHADNFAHYQPVTKVVFSLGMLLGRLEFFTIFALFVPGFWKR
ncbi:MAG: TrkH family potassium uptake protein [Sandaracinaceae bacterium]|nr:TrkH family potassium uptake protein [Sandaracinaceae bacterium]